MKCYCTSLEVHSKLPNISAIMIYIIHVWSFRLCIEYIVEDSKIDIWLYFLFYALLHTCCFVDYSIVNGVIIYIYILQYIVVACMT